jgi:hypothetical protein
MKVHETAIQEILSSGNGTTSLIERLLRDRKRLVQQHEEDLRLARQHRLELDPEKLVTVIFEYGQSALHRTGISDLDVPILASRIFNEFARHALRFTPILDPESDPSTGTKPWMCHDFGHRYADGLVLTYRWPEEANLVVEEGLFSSPLERFRAALMCLENTNAGRYQRVFPLAIASESFRPGWPIWPPEHGPFTLRPPDNIDDFLHVIKVGAGFLNRPSPNDVTASSSSRL